ncbi:Gfo/Idh/MocA family oxidoreductase [Lacihabitans lacunae]|uniref:Gfo/Idh/MocA family oxidoreductase n=1 Tax=Lacihabitans lacunae TaxID=1028214 RepID=A0ABV7YUD7_9BACT
MLNVGLVGFGLSGRYLQAPFFQISSYFNLKSIITSQPIPQELFPGVGKASDFQELLDDTTIEVVSICSPSNTHYDYAKKALNAGKHVLLEKPMTATAAEAKELLDLAKAKNKVLYVFHNRRFDSDLMTVKRVIESGMLGEILSFEAHFDRYKPILNPKKWKEAATPANGILYDLGAHLIDQSIYLFGKPQSVTGEVFTQRENSEIDDAFDLRLDYGKLKVTLKSSLMVKDQGPKYVINGTIGSFTKYGMDVQEDHLVSGYWPHMSGFGVEPKANNGTVKTNLAGLEMEGKIETFAGNWGYLFEDFASVIINGTEPIIKIEQVIDQLEIIESIKAK